MVGREEIDNKASLVGALKDWLTEDIPCWDNYALDYNVPRWEFHGRRLLALGAIAGVATAIYYISTLGS
ncbi:MAG: hypothetical protein ABH840_01390 [Nanoarchaeota archaeon]